MPKITKRLVDLTQPDPGGDRFLWDDELHGFGLRVFPSGVKVYVVRYRTGGRGSQARRRVIGRHGVLTAEEARVRARRDLARVADGYDPAAQKDQTREALTVGGLADLYLTEGPAEKPNKKPSSWNIDRSNIERHIKPLLGRKSARALSQAEVARFQADVAAGKTRADVKTRQRGRAIVEGGRGTAARSLAVLGAMLQFAVGRKLISVNPAKGVPLLKAPPKERFLSEAEIATLADTITAMEGEGALSRNASAAIRLLALTGCRKNEILSLQWDWVDFGRGSLRLPDSKTGAKVVTVPAAALELLSGLPRRSAYVLAAGKGQGHYTGLQKDWESVRARAGLSGVRLHDLRHSFASFAIADGHSLFMVAKMLGHRQTRTTEAYAHLAADPLRSATDRVGNRIAAAMRPKPDTSAEVIRIAPKSA
jgi:integrase